jgi:electron transfer flavoprotein beta subunit
MKILVAVKHVPDTEAQIKIAASGNEIDTQGIKFIINPYDEFAVEEAVRLKEKNPGSEVTVITLGPARAQEALRSALAMGADKGIHINTESQETGDTQAAALLLSSVLKSQEFDLIMVGKQAIDNDEARVGASLAEILNLPFVSNIVQLEVNTADKKAVVKREIEGVSERVESSLPAIFSTQKGLNEPRYPSLIAIMQAKKKEIKVINPAELIPESPQELSSTNILKMDYPPKRTAGKKLEGEIPQVVEQLIRVLKEELKVI